MARCANHLYGVEIYFHLVQKRQKEREMYVIASFLIFPMVGFTNIYVFLFFTILQFFHGYAKIMKITKKNKNVNFGEINHRKNER